MSPREILAKLRERHVSDLTRMQCRCLGLVAAGFGDPNAAAVLGISDSTFRRHVTEAEGWVLDSLGFERTRPTIVTWFWLHQGCCTASIIAMIERNDLGRRVPK